AANILDIARCDPAMVGREVPEVVAAHGLPFELADDVHTGPACQRADLRRSRGGSRPLHHNSCGSPDEALGASAPARRRSDVLYVGSRNPLVQRRRQRIPGIVAVHTAAADLTNDLDVLPV